MRMKQYVIVGNGIAAAGCVEGIRSIDKTSPITILSKEPHPVYCRPLISYYLEGKTKLKNMDYRPADFYEANGCEVLYGMSAEKIDPLKKQVILSDGGILDFSSLCIAAGSSPFAPPFDGLEQVEKQFSFMTLDDALALEQSITPDAKVLIIGAGLIGLKCAEGLRNRVGKITVCDLADRVLSSILDGDTAPLVQRHLEQNGIELMMGDSVVRFGKNTALMKSGRQVEFDVLVTAVGVRPNIALAVEAGIKADRGILVDTGMRTSAEDIFSAGDCAEGCDITLDNTRVLALLPNAYMQGMTAGINMAGGNAAFDKAIPMNSIGFFGLHIMTAGSYTTEEEGGMVYSQTGESGARKFFVKNDLLKGYILVDQVDRGGIYTALIREKTPLHTVNFDLLREKSSFSAFSDEKRRKVLGGVV